MIDEERGTHVKMTLSGRCVTVLAIIGSKKQLSLFPDTPCLTEMELWWMGPTAVRGGVWEKYWGIPWDLPMITR